MAIGAPVNLGGASDATNTVTSLVITTGANAPAGNLICVAIIGSATLNTATVTDSASNTYTLTAAKTWNTANRLFIAYCANPVLLSSGQAITVSWTGVARAAVEAISVSGLLTVAPIDVSGAGTAGTGTSDSIATGTLGAANEIIIALTGLANTTAGYTPGGSFTSLTAPTQGNNSTLLWAYQIVAATTTVSYAPSWTTSRAFGSNVYSFKAPAPANTNIGANLSMMGVG